VNTLIDVYRNDLEGLDLHRESVDLTELLILAIRSVAGGASWWDATATQKIQAAFQNNPQTHDTPNFTTPLTPREREILALIAEGKSNQEIAQILYISLGTVRVHVHAILHKLDVRDRTQAAIVALQKRLIQ
jgi:two-component system NarL family response regulator